MMRTAIMTLAVCLGAVQLASADTILVYDDNTEHQLALQAATSTPGAVVVRAGASTFGSLLSSRRWDLVLVDMPSNMPDAAGFSALSEYVNHRGKAAMSFWTWQTQRAVSDAFGVKPLRDISLTGGTTLYDFGTSSVFAGVTMPNGDWHNHWADDGDVFGLTRGGTALAGLGPHSLPVMTLTNGGRTIAAPLFDEAGDEWLSNGSGRRLWSNMIGLLSSEPAAPTPEPASVLLVGSAAAIALGHRRARQRRDGAQRQTGEVRRSQ